MKFVEGWTSRLLFIGDPDTDSGFLGDF